MEPGRHFLCPRPVHGEAPSNSVENQVQLADFSQEGGLYCDSNGEIHKPFKNRPYCVDGTGSVGAQNLCGDIVSFCQTVLPGNEAMLIPTSVESWSQLAVPDITYWASTAAQYVLLLSGLHADANVAVAIMSTLLESKLKPPASGAMDPKPLATGLPMLLAQTRTHTVTLLQRSDGTQSSPEVI
jgi:hypothetical protein